LQSLIPQPDRKLRYMLATRVEKSYAQAVDRLLAHHGGLQFSKYLRGLIFADAARCGVSTADLDRPSWVTRSYPELFEERPELAVQRSTRDKHHSGKRRRR
jgi:hypothetical protein